MTLKDFLCSEHIELYAALDFEKAKVINEQKLQRFGNFSPKSILILAVPYYIGNFENSNLSLYAISRDYHLYFKELFGRLTSFLTDKFPENTFIPFADSSPIDERHAASISGLGVIGQNGLLITEKYGSYVFLGEVISDLDPFCFFDSPPSLHTQGSCIGCRACKTLCPVSNGECLSQITQKKGELTSDEKALMINHGTLWGCDICQKACPHNKDISTTPIGFFYENVIPALDLKLFNSINKEEFLKRAWSWRGKNTILRNLTIFEKECDND